MKRHSRVSLLILFSALFSTCVAGSLLAQNNPAPLVNLPLVPEVAKPGSAGFTLTVNGTGFVAGAVVKWNGSPRATTVVSFSQVTATINAADVAKTGTAAVTVVNPRPGGGSSDPLTFSVREPFNAVPLAPDQHALEPGAIAVGDFNGDGKVDVVVGNACSDGSCFGTLDFYPGNGNGTFGAPIRTTIAGSGPAFAVNLLVADFNADGKLDIAFTSFDGDGNDGPAGFVMLGNGDGTFTQLGPTVGWYNYNAVAVGDLNGDGLPDLITTGEIPADGTPNTLAYLAGTGLSYTQTENFSCAGGTGAALGDFNGDGKLDVAINGDNGSCGFFGVWIALGNGDGTFQNPVFYGTTYPAGNLAAVDINGDGKLDVVTDGICVLLGNGDGTFKADGCRDANVGVGQGSMVVGDFYGDGKQDVALLYAPSTGGGYGIYVFRGNGKGGFASPVSYALPLSFIGLGAGDFNGDGRTDFVVGFSTANAEVLLQTVASVTPNSLIYPVQLIGTKSASQTVVFTNDQPSALKINSIQVTGTTDHEFVQTNNCGTSVAANSSCQIQVAFTPKTAGAKTASLVASYQGTGGPQTVPITGTASAVKLSPTTINFGDVKVGTTSPPKQATVTNLGATALSISAILVAGGDNQNFSQTNDCGSSLAAGASCTVTVRFTPNAKRLFSSGVEVNDSDITSPDWVFLNGTGT
jgi:hypothetical protein